MAGIKIRWLPHKCAYCKKPVACIVSKWKFISYTQVSVCEDCANELWEEETMRRLP